MLEIGGTNMVLWCSSKSLPNSPRCILHCPQAESGVSISQNGCSWIASIINLAYCGQGRAKVLCPMTCQVPLFQNCVWQTCLASNWCSLTRISLALQPWPILLWHRYRLWTTDWVVCHQGNLSSNQTKNASDGPMLIERNYQLQYWDLRPVSKSFFKMVIYSSQRYHCMVPVPQDE